MRRFYYYYIVKVKAGRDVPSEDEELILEKINAFNRHGNWLLFDNEDEFERRFLFMRSNELSKNAREELEELFEEEVQIDELTYGNINKEIERKLRITKKISYFSRVGTVTLRRLSLASMSDVTEKAGTIVGYGEFKEFLKSLSGYIDRTSEMRVKSMYNIVLLNKCGTRLDSLVEILFNLFSAKKLLVEQALVSLSIDEARRGGRKTGAVCLIDNNEWNQSSYGEFYNSSEEIKALDSIKMSEDIFITVMDEKTYEAYSVIDCFASAFPHTVTIDALTSDEKLMLIESTAKEYSFTVDRHTFDGQKFLDQSLDKIDSDIRTAIKRKIMGGDKSFRLDITDVSVCAKARAKTKKKQALDELDTLIGLEEVKKTVREIIFLLRRRGRSAVPCLHMVFRGNPGTGKTTVARIIARILYEEGIIRRNILVETDREGLVGGYVGQTALKTMKKIESAIGGVLFIDEAYSLFTDGNRVDYGHEAVSTLVKAMEDKRDEFVCIFAGYTKEMDAMLGMNPGLRDRIQFYIDFEDYNPDDLLRIFEKMCKGNNYRLAPAAKESLLAGFSQLTTAKSPNFSNGRLVRKIFERTRIKQALRTWGNTITEQDTEAALAEKDISLMFKGDSRTTIGFRQSAV